MAKLHELLAVESDLEGTYNRILKETGTNFIKHPDRYFGKHLRVDFFDENSPKEADVHKEMDDTVNSKLKYSQKSVVRYLDAVLQKERTNQEARADLIVDGITIAKDVPATFLLGLETKLKKVRTHLYETIPTLQPGVKWEKDISIGKDVYRMVNSEEKFRTKKVMKNHVVSPATDKHPAQVNVYNEDEKVARVITDTWCGMISSAEKSQKLNKIDKLIRSVKKARQKANTAEVVNMTIGKELFDFIEG
jgi:hypothetical protein